MNFEIRQRILKQVVDSTMPLVEEIVIEFGDEGIHTAGVDPSNVAMVDVDLSSNAFSDYNGDDTRRGVNLTRLSNIIGMASSDAFIQCSEEDNSTGKLELEFEGLSYTMSLIEVDSIRGASQDTPDVDWDAEFEIPVSDLKRGKDACSMVSDHLTFSINEDGNFVMSAEGDTDETSLVVEPGDEDSDEDVMVFEDEPNECSAIYSLEYIDDIIDAVPRNTMVDVKTGDGLPVILGFDIAEGDGRVEYVVAPRVEI